MRMSEPMKIKVDEIFRIIQEAPPLEMGEDKRKENTQKKTLSDVLRQPQFIIPRIPVFYVVSKRSIFYKNFKSGEWSLP
ncbi:hypothetical protein ACHQM5_021640 [Ranunculus cassubicifolius]